MAQGSKAAKRQVMAARDDYINLSAFPVEIQHHILSFLPSRDLVQKTCLLARGWRNQWKSVPALRISQNIAFQNAHEMHKFVNYLVFLRGQNPLVECEINFWHEDETFSYIDLWTRYAMSCNVQNLRIINDILGIYCPLPDTTLVSDHLTALELYRVESAKPLLDFSGCSALQDLNLRNCTLEVIQILSSSVKRLIIRNCKFPVDARVRLSVPTLESLNLVVDGSLIPCLDSMPDLVSAFITIRHEGIDHDCCKNRFEIGGCTDLSCEGCTHNKGEGNNSLVLEGLSHAMHLKLLTSEVKMFIFRRDLILCPVFSKLKTLVVDDWCMVANMHALISFLQHSPVLEKLTLISQDYEDEVEKEANYEIAEQPFPSKHLLVEIRCYKISMRMEENLEVLMTYGVIPEQIKIHQSSLGNFCSFASLLSRQVTQA
ncbi:hypothetical protein QOZ80_1BG0085330 [Eleusine coracana subsp. coracana]|nr:hypothetical protein QOZ80_1BG0085330 [Eleusine coracana subsp. coracana]